MKNLLKNKNYRLLAEATTISSIGDSLYSLAITLSIYHITGSIFGIALMWLIRAIIRIPCQAIAGYIVDKYNRKNVSILVYLISAVLMLAFFFMEGKTIIAAYVVIFLLQGISDVDNMAQYGIMQIVVNREELEQANSIFSVLGTIVMLIGPGVGGFIYLNAGREILYLLDAITFIIAAIIIAQINFQEVERKVREFTLFSYAKKGICEIKKMPVIKSIIITTSFCGILGRVFEINKVFVVNDKLSVGDIGLVYLSYAMTIGSILAPLVVKLVKKNNASDSLKYTVFSMALILSFAIWGFAPNIFVSLLACAMIGFFETITAIMKNVIFQKDVDRSVFGFVMAFNRIIMVLSAIIGIVLTPVLTEKIGVGMTLAIVCFLALISLGTFILKSNQEEIVGNSQL
ncbi:Major Facilitator Superfamily protein [Butyrivibrio sp. INlla18]|uniref:MFS transporter n=1 Tax=Butyrivibrio sp. INlla18 TaxID=1520806 RepID=UPI0008885DB3|nr:MFS transporter [Butyrivibrio sp. INlla18]SDA70312.1 Major Facilitator Superfamily protein [Butyrivibrio sp. INlla18]